MIRVVPRYSRSLTYTVLSYTTLSRTDFYNFWALQLSTIKSFSYTILRSCSSRKIVLLKTVYNDLSYTNFELKSFPLNQKSCSSRTHCMLINKTIRKFCATVCWHCPTRPLNYELLWKDANGGFMFPEKSSKLKLDSLEVVAPLFRKKRFMLDEKFKICHILYIQKPEVAFSVFRLSFSLMNALVYVNIDQGIH